MMLTAAATVAGLVAAAASVGQWESPKQEMVLTTRGQQFSYGTLGFAVEGQAVKGLFPGAVRQVKVVLTNPLSVELRLNSLGGKLISTSRVGCPATSASLRVQAYTGALPVTVPPRSRRKLTGSIPVIMPRDATPKCSDTRFRISLFGTGSRVTR
jgi:hypothetical protein